MGHIEGATRIESRTAAVDSLTREDVRLIAAAVAAKWTTSSTHSPNLIDIDVLLDQLADALRTAHEARECERRRALLRLRMLRLLGDD